MARVLIAEDEHNVRDFLAEALELAGHDVHDVARGDAALALLRERAYDVLLTDLKMPGLDGMGLLEAARREQAALQVIVLTAYGTVDSAVRAMKLGAFDYLQKPVRALDELRGMVARAAEKSRLVAAEAPSASGSAPAVPELTWGDPVMAPVVDALRKVAATRATVLLTGQSGTGKEMAARAVHGWSDRGAAAFVAVNCAALSSTLLESELFGHEKGAFTGAHARRQGKIEAADGGTFFLDEVGELTLDLQAKLLRVIEERRFERVGGTLTLSCDVRWVAATNRQLEAMVAEGSFREDLYHRLAVFPVHLPALRERREDLPPLANALLGRIAHELGRPELTLAADAKALIMAAEWPGNARELRNALERAAILAGPDGVLRAEHMVARAAGGRAPAPSAGDGTLEDLEREAIVEALEATGGNRRKAAKRLGIALRTLYNKLKRYEIE